MKKIISLVLILTLSLFAFAACGKKDKDDNNTPAEKTYSLALAVDTTVNANNKVSNTALALVIDAEGKIVSARFDCVEATPSLDESGAIATLDSVATKVEKGDAYTGMAAGSWQKQADAFEKWLVGKTAADIAGTEFTKELIAGCTMTSSMATFKALVAEAFASTAKIAFKAANSFTTGLALSTTVGNKVATNVAATVIVDGKVAATVIDSIEQSFSVVEGAIVAGELKASKNEQGDAYTGMAAGSWQKQGAVYAASTVGKTVAELENLDTVSDALAAAGCTMKSTASYKANIIKAAANAR